MLCPIVMFVSFTYCTSWNGGKPRDASVYQGTRLRTTTEMSCFECHAMVSCHVEDKINRTLHLFFMNPCAFFTFVIVRARPNEEKGQFARLRQRRTFKASTQYYSHT